MAYECLTRGPRGSNFEQAQVLFDYVRLKHDEPAVDRACVASALRSARCDAATSLSLNAAGVRVAVDDIGLGHSNLALPAASHVRSPRCQGFPT